MANRMLIAAAAAMLLAVSGQTAQAQDYPNKQVRVYMGFPAGTSSRCVFRFRHSSDGPEGWCLGEGSNLQNHLTLNQAAFPVCVPRRGYQGRESHPRLRRMRPAFSC